MIKRLVTGSMVGLLALSAQAQEQSSGWLVGAAATFSDYNLDTDQIDDSAVGFQLAAQYRFNRWFGVEATYLYSGELEENTNGGKAELTLDGLTFTAVGYVPLGGDDLSLYGKAGFFSLDQDLQIAGADAGGRKADGLTAGAGFRIKVAEQFSIRTEGNWYDFDDADFWTVSLGLDYHFGR